MQTSTQTRISLLDPHSESRHALASFLRQSGYTVQESGSAQEMMTQLRCQPTALILLDLLPGDQDCFGLIAEIRKRSQVPIVAIAPYADEAEHIGVLECGADDYVSRPFSPRALLARMRALLRRCSMLPSLDGNLTRGLKLKFSGWCMDVDARRLHRPDGREVMLTTGELRMLRAFLEAPRRVLSRDHLLAATRGEEAEPFDRSIDMQVHRLRRKFAEAGASEALIRTERAAGYVFVANVERVYAHDDQSAAFSPRSNGRARETAPTSRSMPVVN